MKPTFTDVDGVKVLCELTEDRGPAHLLVQSLGEGDEKAQILRLNVYDAKYLANACETFLKQATAKNFTGSLAGLSANEVAEHFGEESDD